MLIIDNLNFTMPSKPTLYDEVMNVWTKAMLLLDKLVSGVAQHVISGEALLGLCAWHLYPDMCVFGSTMKTPMTVINQNDALVPKGGILTIGFHHENNKAETGISWSMPLAHLRFYGKAVHCSQMLHSATSRVSFRQVVQIAIGSLASKWNYDDSRPETVARFLLALATSCRNSNQIKIKPWVEVLAEEARDYMDSTENERKSIGRFIDLGRRRPDFLAGKGLHPLSCSHPLSCFGLSEPAFFMMYMDPDQRVQVLRNIAKKFLSDRHVESAIIRSPRPDCQTVEYATVVGQDTPTSKGKLNRRWILLPEIWKTLDRKGPYIADENVFGKDSEHTVVYEHLRTGQRCFQFQKDAALRRSIEIISRTGEICGFLENSTIDNDERRFSWVSGCAKRPALTIDELRYSTNHSGRQWDDLRTLQSWEMGQAEHSYGGVNYVCIFGEPRGSAIYLPCSETDKRDYSLDLIDPLPTGSVTSALSSGCFESDWLRSYFQTLSKSTIDNRYAHYFRSLDALAGASEVYRVLPNADIDLNFGKSLNRFSWAYALQNNQNKLNVSHFHILIRSSRIQII